MGENSPVGTVNPSRRAAVAMSLGEALLLTKHCLYGGGLVIPSCVAQGCGFFTHLSDSYTNIGW